MGNKICCEVKDCAYNKAKECTAKNVEIVLCGDCHAQTCDGTACKTFKTH